MVKEGFLRSRIGIFLLILLVSFALFVPLFSGYSYEDTYLESLNTKPGAVYLLGSDDLGRDMLTRTAIGLRISLFIGISAAFLDMVVGVFYGAFAALSSNKVKDVMGRVLDALYSLPYLLIVMVTLIVLGRSFFSMIISLSITGWITMARITQAEFSYIKEQEYVTAATLFGASRFYIIRKHLLPNAIRPIRATLMMTIPSAIFAESFLSFVGLGVQAPIASLGTMANEGLTALEYYPWRLMIPLTAITLILLSFNMITETKVKQ
jgi:oligopeptide transport system permease protein